MSITHPSQVSYVPTSGPSKSLADELDALATFTSAMGGGVARTITDKFGDFVSARDFGAVGDGITDDSIALANAIATGRNIHLRTGDTYLVSQTFSLGTNQSVYGNGATLKRAAQVSTTTTTTIVANTTTTITVANASIFRVGQTINLLNGTFYDQSNRVILNITGNVITTGTAWNLNGGDGVTRGASGTTTVYLSFYVLVGGPGSRFYDINFDGNKAAWTFYRWEATKELDPGPTNIISGCSFNNSPGDVIEQASVGGGHDLLVIGNKITNANGNGIHLSGSNHTKIIGNTIIGTNLDVTTGHVMGTIGFSNSIAHTYIAGNYLENGRSGVGALDSLDNSDVTITGNTIVGMTTYAIEAKVAASASIKYLIITGNRIYSSGLLSVSSTDNASTPAGSQPNRVIVAHNFLSATKIEVGNCNDVLIDGNVVDFAGDTTSLLINPTNVNNFRITTNLFIGGGYGVYAGSGTGTSFSNFQIQNNSFVGQHTAAIVTAITGMVNIRITGNDISNDSTAVTGYIGINAGAGQTIKDNTLNIPNGATSIGILTANNDIVRDNVVRSAGTYSIRAAGGTTGIIIENNDTQLAVSNAGTNTVSDNNVIP